MRSKFYSSLIFFVGLFIVTSSEIPPSDDEAFPSDESWLDLDLWRDLNIFEIGLEFQKQYPDVFQEAFTVLQEGLLEDPTFQESLMEARKGTDLEGEEIDLFGPFENFTLPNVQPCEACRTLVTALKAVAILDVTQQLLINTLVSVCENVTQNIPIRGVPLCAGVIRLHFPHVFHVLRPLATVSPAEFCEFLNICFPNPTKSQIESKVVPASGFHSEAQGRVESGWKRVQRKRDPVTGRLMPPEGAISVVQLTDIHIEPEYAPWTATRCGLPVCCVPQWGPGRAGTEGDFHCNIPRRTMEIFLSKVNEMNPDIILFSGDVPPHSVWDETEQSQMNCSEQLVDSIKSTLPGRKVYPTIGNHETYPTNLFSFYGMLGDYTRNFVTWFGNLWKDVADFSADELLTIGQGGFYSKLIGDKLRLISLNTNYMYTFNWYNPVNFRGVNFPAAQARPSEYARMTNFTQGALIQARVDGEKVILVSHHPPGGSDYLIEGSRWYRELVLNYRDVIVLQTSGHTHKDEFRMIYDDAETPVSTMFVLPSMSSGGTRNPSMRVYYLHNETKQVLDYDHYFMDLRPAMSVNRETTRVNLTDMIKLLYTASEEYNMADLSPASWHQLLNDFVTDRVKLRQHRRHSQADATSGILPRLCLERCRIRHICRQRHVTFDEYRACVPPLRLPPALNVTLPFPLPTTPPNGLSTDGSSVPSASAPTNGVSTSDTTVVTSAPPPPTETTPVADAQKGSSWSGWVGAVAVLVGMLVNEHNKRYIK